MITVKQDFFDEFKCIAQRCPDTCCSGWQIMIDDASLERYEDYNGNIPERVKASIDFEEGAIRQDGERNCAFLNKNGLCDWILADGESVLCDTCRLYPRHVEEYEDLREWSVSISCPEAARLFLTRDNLVDFRVEEDDEPDPLSDEFDEFDVILFSKLQDARDALFGIVKRNDVTFGEKLGAVLSLSRKMQELYDEDDVFLMDDLIKDFSGKKDFSDCRVNINSFVADNREVFDNLEVLNEAWEDCLEWLDCVDDILSEALSVEDISTDRHELILSNLLIYYLYTYYLGSVYNGMIFGYAGMCAFGAVVSEVILICRQKKESESISLEDYVETVYRYSRETEHSDINIEELLKHFDSQV